MIDAMNRTTPEYAAREAKEQSEDFMTRTLENQAAKVPSDIWLFAALGAMGVSLYLQMQCKKEDSQFVGQWAAPLMLIGVYNKLVKIASADRVHRGA